MIKSEIRSQHTFNVVPSMPKRLEPLREMAYNLWWSWEARARGLYRSIDTGLWEATNHSPVKMLQNASQKRMEELAEDETFLQEMDEVWAMFTNYMRAEKTYAKDRGDTHKVAYFSAEFGFHESVPIYSGGLGILSGDHCKSASDLGVNFSAVTLFYRHGYFRQLIDKDGQQFAEEHNQNFHRLPAQEVKKGSEIMIFHMRILDRQVAIKVWQMEIGRITLYLLDTDLAENRAEDRLITAQLYGGDQEMRILQEIVLGIGGVRVLKELGIEPDVWHMNEGHSAFMTLERIREIISTKGLDFRSALQVVAASSVFTTHTPVPAGNDAFSRQLIEKYFSEYIKEINVSTDYFMSFGQEVSDDKNEPFSMTVLALRTARFANAVSKLHGEVSRNMWKNVWLNVPVEEVPITSITNGVHTKTWLAPEMARLYDKYLGSDWEQHLTDPEYWRRVIDIPSEELWETHQALKKRLIEFTRDRLRKQRARNGESPESIRRVNQLLNPEILTIGFARRFATYKRATLLFDNPERLLALISNKERPVQFIFAGKAHPADKEGQQLIRKVVEFSRLPEFEQSIAFIEDYDAYIGRRLTQGVDLWLNTPMRPLEASGTSGMKLPPNGGLNLSVLDGWWLEAYNGKNGWAIGQDLPGEDFIGRTTDDANRHEQIETDSESLYQLLEQRVTSLFYAKPDGYLPSAWIQLMSESIRSVTPVYNTHRMVSEYNERLYQPAAIAGKKLITDNCKNAVDLAIWKDEMRNNWPQVRFIDSGIELDGKGDIDAGSEVNVWASIHLGTMDPNNICVQAYYGDTDDDCHIQSPTIANLQMRDKKINGDGTASFVGKIPAMDSGAYGINFRITPKSDFLTQDHELRLITWIAKP